MSNTTLNFSSASEYRNSSGYQDISAAGQFVTLAKDIATSVDRVDWIALSEKYAGLPHHGRIESFAKAAATLGVTWSNSDGTILSEAYLRTIAAANLVDAVAKYATPLPDFNGHIVVASGVTAEEVDEGAIKAVSDIEVTADAAERYKVAAMLVVSRDLLKLKTSATENLFRRLLRDAVIRASNQSFLGRLPTISVAAGANAVGSLQAGLAAADDSEGYVVAATPAIARELALAADGRMGINGGEFIPGVHVLPALEASSTSPDLVVIPASSVALTDSGLALRHATHATVDIDGVQTNLWQRNLAGLLVERIVSVRGASPAVEVG